MVLRCLNSLAATLLLALPATAQAQAFQCRAPQVRSVPQIAADGPRRLLPITGYVLALSWSPEFCKARREAPAHAMQCSGSNGSFGLVVHGLWPQSGASWPQWCEAGAALTPAEARAALCMMPSSRLAARQWAKHGACMASRPANYLAVMRVLWESLRIPDYDRISREDGLTAGRIRAAFADANPWVPEQAIGVHLNERGWLEELRVCWSKAFYPARCSARNRGAGDGSSASIWRGL
jgi:ribonuclease T2